MASVNRFLTRWVPRALAAAQIAIVLMIARNWAYVTTYRLDLDRRVDAPLHSAAAQQFDIESDRVVARIVTRGADGIQFRTNIGQDAFVNVEIRPRGPVSYAIRWREGAADRTLASGRLDTTTAIRCPYPTGTGVLALESDGPVSWVDPRVVRTLRIAPHAAALAILVAASVVWRRHRRHPTLSRLCWFRAAALGGSFAMATLAAEAGLHAMRDVLPSGIATERHDLGEVTHDPRWEDSPRYGRRLRRRVNTLNEWRYGDIVRMGFIPATVSDGTLHMFRFVTDDEGFRNPRTREHVDIAALGDSFTDAMTMGIEASWPMRLERRLGVAVQNYGTAGFGPQQELLALKEFVAPHRPARVVLAFFAGNDIFDAEAFDEFERANGHSQRVEQGWRIKDVISRADTWYVVSALKAGAHWLGQQHGPQVDVAAQPLADPPSVENVPASFDRGMFEAVVNGHRLRWALMPPYLNTLNFSKRELEGRRGWTLTRAAILEMQRTTRGFDGELIVMFIPFKSQVYWPLLERAFSRDQVTAALNFYLEGNQRPLDLDAMRHNRFAQNDLIRRLCEDAQIPFVDTTAALEARLETGENVYFPDESHLNEVGQGVVTDALAAFLSH